SLRSNSGGNGSGVHQAWKATALGVANRAQSADKNRPVHKKGVQYPDAIRWFP
ncbi:hypothetical protein H6F86_03275, partial [Phormidium sp. FACHB-592]|nr:hypothetical protein [Phormidium sp. FACHB-592]